MNIGVILAAGVSERFQSVVHKQYLKLNGKEVIYYSVNGMKESACFDKIIAVVDEDEFNSKYIANKYNITCVKGGDKRNKSIKAAIDYIADTFEGVDKIVFQDCSRPFVKKELYQEFISQLDSHSAVIMSSDINDTLSTHEGIFVNRKEYCLIQTPEAFHFEDIKAWFSPNRECTAIVNQMPDKSDVLLYKPNSFNINITYPEDLFLAEQFMNIDYLRLSSAGKVHPKIEGKVLLLGGSGGVGQCIVNALKKDNVEYFAPTHSELDLQGLTIERIQKACPFAPDVIINVAAAYANDSVNILESYDKIFDVNLRSNLVLIEYAKTLNKKVHLVLMSSSSSTRGRENLTNYSAAKAALNSVVESQGETLRAQNIIVNALIPEKINTPLIAKLHKTEISSRELLEAEEVVNSVMYYSITDEYGKLVHIRKGL
ncbi:MAG: SDR family oxidoreductase [Clostridia bacterium]|nr:SDR family oxidoreductase [Clostridia bacterium]